MTKAVATQSQAVALPTISYKLESLITEISSLHPDIGMNGVTITEQGQAEAARVLALYDRATLPPSTDMVVQWLLPLMTAVSNPPMPEVFTARAGAIAAALFDIPSIVLTLESATKATRRWKFWPSVMEIHGYLLEEAAPIRERRRALQRIVDAKPSQQSHRPASQEERDKISKGMDGLVAELKARSLRNIDLPKRPKPEYLDRGDDA